MTKQEAAAYLAGMIDGEGHIRVGNNRSASVSSTDWDLIEATVECCDILRLNSRISRMSTPPGRKQAWEVFMHGKDTMLTIQREVPIRCKRKQAAIAEAISRYRQLPRPPKEWLEQKYLVEGLSLQQCAEAWGAKNSTSAWCWTQYYGIPCRTIGGGQTKYPRPEREWLQARVDEGLTLKQIGDLVAAPLAAVWRWCQFYGISREPIRR